MTTERLWAERVAAWRSSGLSAPAFCAGKDFTASGLRYWSSRLRRAAPTARTDVRIARVVSNSIATTNAADNDTAITIELGVARVGVRRGFDAPTLLRLLEVLRDLGATR